MIRFLVVFVAIFSYTFGLVSIRPAEVGEQKDSIEGKLYLALSNQRGVSNTDSYKGTLKLSYDSNTTYIIWGELAGAYGKANGVKNTQNLYLHLRYIHNITSKRFVYEIFAQAQDNEFKQIKDRSLVGGGVRVKFLKDFVKELDFFVGFGGFYEYIDYLDTYTDPTERNIRLNGYIAINYPFKSISNKSKLTLTSYYQPKVSSFGDFISYSGVNLKLGIYKHLFFAFIVRYEYDSKPAVGVDKNNFYQESAVIFEF